MFRVAYGVTIDAPIEKVWRTLARWSNLAEYSPSAKRSLPTSKPPFGIGATRRLGMFPFGYLEERAIVWNEPSRMAVELDSSSMAVKRLTTDYSLAPAGDRATTLTLEVVAEMKYGYLGGLMETLVVVWLSRRIVQGLASGLKHHVETGKAVPTRLIPGPVAKAR